MSWGLGDVRSQHSATRATACHRHFSPGCSSIGSRAAYAALMRTGVRPRRAIAAGLIVAAMVAGLAGSTQAPAVASTASRVAVGACLHPDVPERFHDQVVTAIRISGDLPRRWASSPALAKIVCWQGTDFDRRFRKSSGDHLWHGMFAMTRQEMRTVFGAWNTRKRDAFLLTARCFVFGWEACPHTTANTAAVQQIIAGLRWIWLRYGGPRGAWVHIERTGRFNSYPRPGTVDDPTRDPLQVCPVAGSIGYLDTFGQRRTVGGYHPHWGNDISAPDGRKIRAPFDGLAVGHSDNWFAGHSVTVVGEEGYVRNAHLIRFGRLGYVKAGTVIGYVGHTGDARSSHDHFEWHPWSPPERLHVSPYGYSMIMDAIDPFPFLNKACGG